MQKTIFLVLFFMLNALNATNLLKYDVFDGEQNIDLKLSFDTPYRGEITQTNEKNMVIVTLKDLNLAEKFNHQINSQIGSEFVISPMDNAVKIELMLKFSQSTQSAILPQSKAQDESEIQPSNLVRNGVILITALLIFIVFLIIAKRMFGTKNGKNDDEIWTAFENASMDNTAQKMDKESDLNTNLDDINIANLQPNFVLKNDDENIRFSNNIAQSIKNSEKISEQNSKNKAQNDDKKCDEKIEILSQKEIDDETKMAILKFKNRHFVLFLGEKNMLFTQNESQNIEDIKKILQEN